MSDDDRNPVEVEDENDEGAEEVFDEEGDSEYRVADEEEDDEGTLEEEDILVSFTFFLHFYSTNLCNLFMFIFLIQVWFFLVEFIFDD